MQASAVRLFRLLPLLAGLLLVPAGCAKSPSGISGNSTSGPQVTVSMTVAGTLNPNYYYFILFNATGAVAGAKPVGPIPVFAAPYGNGFAAGAFTNYVQYHNGQPGGTNLGFWTISSDLLTPSYLGSSSPYLVQSEVGSNTFTVQIPLADLANAGTPAAAIQNLEVNFIATNVLPPPSDTLTAKYVDALYPTNVSGNLNSFVIIPTTQSGIYQNSDQNIEPAGDVTQYVGGGPTTVTSAQFADAADLDIINWSVQISN